MNNTNSTPTYLELFDAPVPNTPVPNTVTLNEGLLLVYHAIQYLMHHQPGTLALVGSIFLTVSLIMVGVPLFVVLCCFCMKRRASRLREVYAKLEHGIDDMNVELDSDESDEESTPRDSIVLPRLSLAQLVSTLPRPPPYDTEDLHMTPRTRAAIIGEWTARKREEKI
jgi:hypothetical protein